jgi:hypothetical protein
MHLIALLAVVAVAMTFVLSSYATGPNVQDAATIQTVALPNGAATVTSTAIDTGASTRDAQQVPGIEYQISAPALTTGQLANAATMTYTVQWSANANLSGPTTYINGAIVQTGAGGAGAAAATFNFRLPSAAGRYVFITVTNSGAGNASAANATLTPLF